MSSKSYNSRYPDTFKLEAVKEVLKGTRQLKVIADELGITDKALSRWKHEYQMRIRWAKHLPLSADGGESSMGDLVRDNQRLRQEVDFLKKATAYFAKNIK